MRMDNNNNKEDSTPVPMRMRLQQECHNNSSSSSSSIRIDQRIQQQQQQLNGVAIDGDQHRCRLLHVISKILDGTTSILRTTVENPAKTQTIVLVVRVIRLVLCISISILVLRVVVKYYRRPRVVEAVLLVEVIVTVIILQLSVAGIDHINNKSLYHHLERRGLITTIVVIKVAVTTMLTRIVKVLQF